jgi:hypothetical protein
MRSKFNAHFKNTHAHVAKAPFAESMSTDAADLSTPGLVLSR